MTSSDMRPRCRLRCLLARDSSKAVIFRRGPSKQTCLIAWDRLTDTFEVGQWFKGSVYPERSHLSPDGEWLLVFMGNFHRPLYAWTVLSRPPWFTAVALWAEGDTWRGGGVFLGDKEIVLSRIDGSEPRIGEVPEHFKVHLCTPDIHQRVDKAFAKDPHAWHTLGGDWRGPFQRREGDSTLTMTWCAELRGWDEARVFKLAYRGSAVSLPSLDWADLDRNGDLLFSRDGALYRLAQADFVPLAGEDEVLLPAKLLADFAGLRFQSVRAPYGAPSGPGVAGYAPSLDRTTKEDRRARRRLREGGRHR